MMIGNFRRQHQELGHLASALDEAVNAIDEPEGPQRAKHALAQLTGKLKIHLVMEDGSLYPRLLQAPSAETAQTAQRFMTEMGGLSATYMSYATKWKQPGAIDGHPELFTSETKGILKVLGERIKRENRELYPLAESLTQ